MKKHAAAIAKSGVNIRVLSCVSFHSDQFFKKTVSYFVDENGIENTQIMVESRFFKLFHILPFLQRRLVEPEFRKMHEKKKADILHSTIIFPSAILTYKIAKKYDLPHVITEHWTKIDKFMARSLFAKKAKLVYESAKCVTAVSLFLKENIEKYDRSGNVIRIPNVINNKVFYYRPKQTDPDKYTFTCVAQWNYPKRLDLIMHSLNSFTKSSVKKVHLNVIGNGAMVNEFRKQKWSFTVDYLSNIPPENIAELIHTSDFFIHASDIETFSVVIAEALCTGTPVIASGNTAIVELINEQNGLLCENDLSKWETALQKIVQMKFDHEAIAQIAGRFTDVKIGEMFKEMYERVLKKN